MELNSFEFSKHSWEERMGSVIPETCLISSAGLAYLGESISALAQIDCITFSLRVVRL